MQQRFNIALLPVDPGISQLLTQFSRSSFLEINDGYILGEDGLPHITLCQFRAKDEATALKAFETLTPKKPITLATTKLYARPGTPPANAGKFIIVVGIEKTQELLALQNNVFNHLERAETEPLTKPETYSPHITLTRLAAEPHGLPPFEDFPFGAPLEFFPNVGLSTESGVFVKRLDRLSAPLPINHSYENHDILRL